MTLADVILIIDVFVTIYLSLLYRDFSLVYRHENL